MDGLQTACWALSRSAVYPMCFSFVPQERTAVRGESRRAVARSAKAGQFLGRSGGILSTVGAPATGFGGSDKSGRNADNFERISGFWGERPGSLDSFRGPASRTVLCNPSGGVSGAC